MAAVRSYGAALIPTWFGVCGGVVGAGLVGVEEFGECGEGVVGDGDGDGGLCVFLVPQDGQVEDGEQAVFECGRQVGEDVAGVGDLVQDGGVGGLSLTRITRSGSSAAGRIETRRIR